MTLQQVKQEAEALSFEEQGEVAAYLVQLRNRRDPEYIREIERKIGDKDRAHWLSPDEFERRLDAR